MGADELQRFIAHALEDAALQQRLRTVPRPEFVDIVVQSGRELGFDFGKHDVEHLQRERRTAWVTRWI